MGAISDVDRIPSFGSYLHTLAYGLCVLWL